MKTTLLLVLAVSTGLLAASAPMLAHHSFAAEFDGTKPVALTGTVTKVDWVNPHSWIYTDVKGDDGTVANWGMETGPPNVLYRARLAQGQRENGRYDSVHGFAAKDGSHTVAARQIQTADGRKLFAGSAGRQRPEAVSSARSGACATFVFVLASSGFAQLGPAQEPSPIRVDVDVVNVLCTVSDKRGALVTDLDKEDFEIREDGRSRRSVTSRARRTCRSR